MQTCTLQRNSLNLDNSIKNPGILLGFFFILRIIIQMKKYITISFLILAGIFTYLVFKGQYFSFLSSTEAPVPSRVLTRADSIQKLVTAELRDYDDKPIKLDESKFEETRSVILHFWASWCAPCIAEVPELIAFAKRNKDVAYVIVSVDEDQKDIQKFLKSFPGFGSKIFIKIWDGPSRLSTYFDVDRLPMSIVIRANQTDLQYIRSAVDWKNFKL